MRACDERGESLIIRIDTGSTSPALVRHLAAIEAERFDRGPGTDRRLDDDELARFVAGAIAEPGLNAQRILEVRAPELDAEPEGS